MKVDNYACTKDHIHALRYTFCAIRPSCLLSVKVRSTAVLEIFCIAKYLAGQERYYTVKLNEKTLHSFPLEHVWRASRGTCWRVGFSKEKLRFLLQFSQKIHKKPASRCNSAEAGNRFPKLSFYIIGHNSPFVNTIRLLMASNYLVDILYIAW
jgi:hypothetical protein